MVKNGKTLIFMDDSCNYAINKFKMPVTNVMEENSKVTCPGSYLRVEVKNSRIDGGHGKDRRCLFQVQPDV